MTKRSYSLVPHVVSQRVWLKSWLSWTGQGNKIKSHFGHSLQYVYWLVMEEYNKSGIINQISHLSNNLSRAINTVTIISLNFLSLGRRICFTYLLMMIWFWFRLGTGNCRKGKRFAKNFFGRSKILWDHHPNLILPFPVAEIKPGVNVIKLDFP